jgi:hypothetical protein
VRIRTVIVRIGVPDMNKSRSTRVSLSGTAANLDEEKVGIGHAVRWAAAHALAWIETCGDYYKAAAIYEQLSGLSDAELHRRGFSRATLASDIVRACDRTEL